MKIAIPGAGGRMGGMLIREIAKAEDLQLVAATDRSGSLPAINPLNLLKLELMSPYHVRWKN